MMKEEFSQLVKRPLTDSQYTDLQTVYTFHPCISQTEGKKQIAYLYETFGFGVIKDMLQTAERARDIEEDIRMTKIKLQEYQQELEELKAGTY